MLIKQINKKKAFLNAFFLIEFTFLLQDDLQIPKPPTLMASVAATHARLLCPAQVCGLFGFVVMLIKSIIAQLRRQGTLMGEDAGRKAQNRNRNRNRSHQVPVCHFDFNWESEKGLLPLSPPPPSPSQKTADLTL